MVTVTGYTAGVFDMFHIGHLNLLTKARERCDSLIVGLTTDELCEHFKGKTPVVPFEERAAILRSLRVVDEVVPQVAMDRYAAWKARRFDVTFVGDDWQGSELWAGYERTFAQVGVDVVYLPYTPHISSSILRQTLHSRSA
ncbi:adenylyltransferase/cytidyltransferase family protein [Herbiconiux sp. 11R-BC]|uniref:adenylyltransferase/cytidyltransferase family protein n=1 Tax=Herbiconiux sp. 11R-BC TaxID=3111637 RepID=UPI003C016FE0